MLHGTALHCCVLTNSSKRLGGGIRRARKTGAWRRADELVRRLDASLNPDKHTHHCKKVYLSIDASTLHSKRTSSSPIL
jgi:hypothetical protein